MSLLVRSLYMADQPVPCNILCSSKLHHLFLDIFVALKCHLNTRDTTLHCLFHMLLSAVVQLPTCICVLPPQSAGYCTYLRPKNLSFLIPNEVLSNMGCNWAQLRVFEARAQHPLGSTWAKL